MTQPASGRGRPEALLVHVLELSAPCRDLAPGAGTWRVRQLSGQGGVRPSKLSALTGAWPRAGKEPEV